jgi:uncharacterized peroxidase-related enzyme
MAYVVRGLDPAECPPLAEIEQKTGTSNFYRAMAHRPDAMVHFNRLYSALTGPTALLDRRIREMIYITVSQLNECPYCESHHTRSAAAAGLSESEIHYVKTENDSHFSPKERAALQYARELTRTSLVGDDTRYRVQEHLSIDEFVELTMIVCLANFTNRFNNGISVPLEDSRNEQPMLKASPGAEHMG